MGCCLSRDGSRSEVKEQPLTNKRSPVTEVETVKEVLLSETPTPAEKPTAEIDVALLDRASNVKAVKLEQVKDAEEASPAKAEAQEIETVVEETKSLKLTLPVADEVSDASEAYSFNESRSTTTVTEIRDAADEVEVGSSYVKHRINNRSPTQRLAARPQNRQPLSRNGAASYSKPRPEWNQSPCRKPALEVRQAGRESPVRRTVSPAGARSVTGLRPINRGPTGPCRPGHGRMEETLENPLVSLECFIFL